VEKIYESSFESILISKMGLFENNVRTDKIFNRHVDSKDEMIKEFLETKPLWTISSVTWPKKIFITIGFFDEKLKRLQDVDLHIRFLLTNYKISFHNIVDCWYRIENQKSDKVIKIKYDKLTESYLLFIDKFYQNQILTDVLNFNHHLVLKRLFWTVLFKYFIKSSLKNIFLIYQINAKYNFFSFFKLPFIFIMMLYNFLGLKDKSGYVKLKLLVLK
jgi:hypothetical protein